MAAKGVGGLCVSVSSSDVEERAARVWFISCKIEEADSGEDFKMMKQVDRRRSNVRRVPVTGEKGTLR